MRLSLRAVPVAFALLAALPDLAHAQSKQIELRIDALTYERTTGRSSFDVRVPGAAAIAWYLNDNVALESRLIGLRRTTSEAAAGVPSFTTTTLTAAVFAPVHFGSRRGRSGFFAAPGLIVNAASVKTSANVLGSPGSNTTVNYGLDVGFKHTLQGRVSLRHALTYRTGDNLADKYGATSGISIFFR
jgi:hypothetical protein